MNLDAKAIIFFLVGVILHNNLFAQNGKVTIEFISDTIMNNEIDGATINIFQNNKLLKCKINDKINVNRGVAFGIEFENFKFSISGIKSLSVYKDTIINVSIANLEPVIVSAKKRIVRQSLRGFDYYPANDSIFKSENLLISLQRLPFINVVADESVKYANGENILFQINGKERPGIGNNWNNILKAIKAKDIYKVELITELPTFAKNRGYDVIINILTLDANLSGKTFNVAAILDTRKNINTSTDYTLLNKRTDFSIVADNINDHQQIFTSTKIFDNDTVIVNNILATKYVYHAYNAAATYGLRIDSSNDIGVKIRLSQSNNKQNHSNIFSSPKRLNNQKNIYDILSGNIVLSYVRRKKDYSSRSLVVSINAFPTKFGNKLSPIISNKYDSTYYETKIKPYEVIAEYNFINTQHATYNIEYGIQVYNKKFNQSNYEFSIDSLTNKRANLLKETKDSLIINQWSAKPYFKIDKDFSANKNLTLNVEIEQYTIDNTFTRNTFLLPGVNSSYKILFKNNSSLKYYTDFHLDKPSIDFFTGVLRSNSPIELRETITELIPGKKLNIGLEFTKVSKATFSHNLSFDHNFDEPSFFTRYDSSKKILITSANNGGLLNTIKYSFYFKKQIKNFANFSISIIPGYVFMKNRDFGTTKDGFTINTESNFNIRLPHKIGVMGFISLIRNNAITTQGYYNGTIRYSVYYSKAVIKKKILLSIKADEFLLKNRRVNSYSYYNSVETYSTRTVPYRLFSLRLAYKFSDIKVEKFSQKKSTYIQNEKSIE